MKILVIEDEIQLADGRLPDWRFVRRFMIHEV